MTASASAAVNSCTLEEMFIEQNLGPHMEQKCASLKPSSGRVSSCMDSAISGSSDSANCFFQSKVKRAAGKRVVAVAGTRPMPRQIGRMCGNFISDNSGPHIIALYTRPALFYILLNIAASVAALALTRAFGWTFGASGKPGDTTVRWTQALVAGIGAMALFRTSLFTDRA